MIPLPPAVLLALRFTAAPLVNFSSLPFRLLCRKHGAGATYSEMIEAKRFLEEESYRAQKFQTCAEDFPLIVQFASNDAEEFLACVLAVQSEAAAVCLNLGCPQRRAKTSHYGAWLLDDVDRPLLLSIISRATSDIRVKIPIVCKIRLLPTIEESIKLCQELEAAGVSLIAIHGRQRGSEVSRRSGPADLSAIAQCVKAVKIPILSNGNVRTQEDARKNLKFTGAAGVLVGEAILNNPAFFEGIREFEQQEKEHGEENKEIPPRPPTRPPIALLREYLTFLADHPIPNVSPNHPDSFFYPLFFLHRVWREELEKYSLMDSLMAIENLPEFLQFCEKWMKWIENPSLEENKFPMEQGKLEENQLNSSLNHRKWDYYRHCRIENRPLQRFFKGIDEKQEGNREIPSAIEILPGGIEVRYYPCMNSAGRKRARYNARKREKIAMAAKQGENSNSEKALENIQKEDLGEIVEEEEAIENPQKIPRSAPSSTAVLAEIE